MVQTMRLPLCRMRSRPASDRKPWFIQCRWMTSAWRNSGWRVMSVPVLAMSTYQSMRRLRRLCIQMTSRSQINFSRKTGDWGRAVTPSCGAAQSRTSMRASVPLARKASIRRSAAIAAPPPEALVFTISTFIFTRFSLSLILYSKAAQKYEHFTNWTKGMEYYFPKFVRPQTFRLIGACSWPCVGGRRF